ncbi:hypothetical protein B0H11DRAFT_2239117 [Mycena galericulata]|nr:hypothetical protein B0H11DRAFT_2239117 [Mycena galericulata]
MSDFVDSISEEERLRLMRTICSMPDFCARAQAVFNSRLYDPDSPGIIYVHRVPDPTIANQHNVKVGRTEDLEGRRGQYARKCKNVPIEWCFYYHTAAAKLLGGVHSLPASFHLHLAPDPRPNERGMQLPPPPAPSPNERSYTPVRSPDSLHLHLAPARRPNAPGVPNAPGCNSHTPFAPPDSISRPPESKRARGVTPTPVRSPASLRLVSSASCPNEQGCIPHPHSLPRLPPPPSRARPESERTGGVTPIPIHFFASLHLHPAPPRIRTRRGTRTPPGSTSVSPATFTQPQPQCIE